MTKYLIAAAAAVLAHPALAQRSGAISVINAESADGFADFRECEAVLKGRAKAAAAADRAGRSATPAGSVINRARGHISRCAKLDGEILIIVYPAVGQSSPGA